MLRITQLSGEELTSLPLAELSDVKALKQRLHQQHGMPPRFRQRLLHESGEKGRELRQAAWFGHVAKAGCALVTADSVKSRKPVILAPHKEATHAF